MKKIASRTFALRKKEDTNIQREEKERESDLREFLIAIKSEKKEEGEEEEGTYIGVLKS